VGNDLLSLYDLKEGKQKGLFIDFKIYVSSQAAFNSLKITLFHVQRIYKNVPKTWISDSTRSSLFDGDFLGLRIFFLWVWYLEEEGNSHDFRLMLTWNYCTTWKVVQVVQYWLSFPLRRCSMITPWCKASSRILPAFQAPQTITSKFHA
jgi:hypothetical protein